MTNRFLFVCTANMLRSPTCEHVARTLGFSADSAGTDPCAVRPLTKEAVERAQEIICMETRHAAIVTLLLPLERQEGVKVWNIPDNYDYCDPDLIKLIRTKLGYV